MDLREYVCPEDIFQARVLSYISVTQFSCPRLTNTTRRVWTTLDTRTFDRWRLLADLTDTANKTTGSLALFFDVTGEGKSSFMNDIFMYGKKWKQLHCLHTHL